jgi:hypothetical protein
MQTFMLSEKRPTQEFRETVYILSEKPIVFIHEAAEEKSHALDLSSSGGK